MGYPYDDGLDDDGYPLPVAERPQYRHGSEEDAEGWKPTSIGEVLPPLIRKLHLFPVRRR
jgi:hypothetical protein